MEIPTIVGIDPGTTESAWCCYDPEYLGVVKCCIEPNEKILERVYECSTWNIRPVLVVEEFRNFGMTVGLSTFRTVRWSGRFEEAAISSGVRIEWLPRKTVTLKLCGSSRAKDVNVRAALIDAVGPPGRKSDPGPTYGVSKHGWSALALAYVFSEYGSEIVFDGEP